MGIARGAKAAGFTLEQAWLELADFERPSLQLRERYEVLLRPAEIGDPTEHTDRPWQVFEPTDRPDRARMADRRELQLRKNLFDMLRDGVLRATGMQISPGVAKRRAEIEPAFFKGLDAVSDDVDWSNGVVRVGATVFADVLVLRPQQALKRGRPNKSQDVRDAITRALTEQQVRDLSYNEIHRALLRFFESRPDLRPDGGVSEGTVARVVRGLRTSQK